jgi:hypothetical protein
VVGVAPAAAAELFSRIVLTGKAATADRLVATGRDVGRRPLQAVFYKRTLY